MSNHLTTLSGQKEHYAAVGADPGNTINWLWTLADMDKLQAMVLRRATAIKIAEAFATDAAEIREVCKRNGIVLYRHHTRQPRAVGLVVNANQVRP